MSEVVDLIGAAPARVSEVEWQARVELAACYRLVHYYGWTDQVYNHITLRIPGTDHLLINEFGLRYDEITPSSLVKIDISGKQIDGDPRPVNLAGYTIHSAVHAARPDDLHCVLHTHSDNAVALSCLDCEFMPITQTGCAFDGRVGYHEFEGIALDLQERARLVSDLGDTNHTLVLRNHGVLTAGESAAITFHRLYSFEQAAGIQLRVMAASGASGVPIRKPAPQVVSHTRQQFEGGAAQAGAIDAVPSWPGYLRLLDSLDANWRQ